MKCLSVWSQGLGNSPFHYKTFNLLFAAQLMALMGSGFTQMALALLAFDIAGTQAAWVLGIAWSVRVLAFVIFAPLFAAWLHHFPRKQWLISLDIGRSLLVLCLLWVTDIWQICLLIFLLNMLSAGFTPTFQALLPDVLEKESVYTRALSHTRLASELERLLGPVLAGIALFFISYHNLFVLNAISFIISAALIAVTPLPSQKSPGRQPGLWHNLTYGLNGYLRTPRLKALLGLHLAVAATGSMVIINTVGQVQGVLAYPESVTAWMMSATGFGAILAARLTPWLLEKHLSDYQLLTGSGILLAIVLWPTVLIEVTLTVMAVLWFLIGLGSAFILTPTGRLLNRSCHPADRNTFFATHFSLSHATWLLCYPLAGWFGSSHFSHAAFFMALAALAGSGFALWQWSPSDPEELWHEHRPQKHQHPHTHDEHHQPVHPEGNSPHHHAHTHTAIRHKHRFVIDEHHPHWPDH